LNRAAPALTGDARLRIQPPYLKSKRSFDQSACFSLRLTLNNNDKIDAACR